jgi:hypothetical protein
VNFAKLTAVEIGYPNGQAVEVSRRRVIVNTNRLKVLRKMDRSYKEQFQGKAEGFYATASVVPDTFRRDTLLSQPPTYEGPGQIFVVHWWLTKKQFKKLMCSGGGV